MHGQAKALQAAPLGEALIWTCGYIYENKGLQALSIRSLPLYASSATYFVAVAPHCEGGDIAPGRRTVYDESTYSMRGWCRLEQWARLTVGGLQNMFLYDGCALRPLEQESAWTERVLDIFVSGEFTVASDKWALVDSCVGLWATVLRQRDQPHIERIYKLVEGRKATVFPAEYFEDLVELLEDDCAA